MRGDFSVDKIPYLSQNRKVRVNVNQKLEDEIVLCLRGRNILLIKKHAFHSFQ